MFFHYLSSADFLQLLTCIPQPNCDMFIFIPQPVFYVHSFLFLSMILAFVQCHSSA